ncbi:MAG TPA: hypothetical protein PLX89_26645 [Verrucomicrobiota bacterium]|nr:hypothetical protein [Verrucomicrobiales bacterium]HRI16588.1 hypothetical protein [Verrucomicrobiota bacterium]
MATNYLVAGWNAHTAATAFFGGLGNKVGLVPVYQPGPLGPYYYPTTGSSTTLNALRNIGSQTAANAGLYHHTTTPDQAKEAGTQVDIGFHYVAATTATPIKPLDTDTDSLPDYLEDADGNGTPTTGETSWTSVNADADGEYWKDPEEMMYGTRGLFPGVDRDSDGDGIADHAEVAQGTDPTEVADTSPKLLGDWRFNTGLVNQQSVGPLPGATASTVSSFEGSAVYFGASVPPTSALRYPVANCLNLRWGTVHFTYVPDWYLGNPSSDNPGQWCRLLECGPWQLSITPDGRYLVFETPAADGTITRNATVPLPRPAERTAWEIDLQYCRAFTRVKINSATYLDLYEPVGVSAKPSASVIANGFVVGSAADGTLGARGYIDQLLTFNALLEIQNYSVPKVGPTPLGNLWNFETRRRSFLAAIPESNGLRLKWLRGWEGDPTNPNNYNNYRLQRRLTGQSTWNNVVTTPPVLTTDNWLDTGLTAGVSFDYRITRKSAESTFPTLTATWQAAPIENRGRALLVVDKSLAGDLSAELATFTDDLIGEGWTVVRKALPTPDAPRHVNTIWEAGAINPTYIADLHEIKDWIKAQWQANSAVPHVVILVGHVTVPYSGSTEPLSGFGVAEDGHEDHRGAWAADAWYGDVSGAEWADTVPLNLSNPNLRNVAGDHKWDYNYRPSSVTIEIPVGRIDFDNLEAFSASFTPAPVDPRDREIKLIKRYLDKIHRYRRGELTFDSSLRVVATDDRFTQLHQVAPPVAAQFFGTDLPDQHSGDAFTALPSSRSATLWAFHGGSGRFDRVAGSVDPVTGDFFFHSSGQLAGGTLVGDFGFGVLSGSYFADWNQSGGSTINNFLRSCLAQPNTGLAVMADFAVANRPWNYHAQARGEPLASALTAVLNQPAGSTSVRTLFIQGDPTLKPVIVKPVTDLRYSSSGPLELLWNASGTPGAGYWVYSTTTTDKSSWTRLTTGNPITTLSYPLPNPTGVKFYQVRAVALQSSGGGSFNNVSVGTFKSYP